MASSRTKAVTLAGSPAHHTHERFARPERARDPRGDRYDHSLAFDPRTDLSKPARGKRGPIETSAVAVDNSLSPGKRVMTSVNRRIDVLEMERSHGRLTVSQYEVGRQVQAIFERASGARLRSMDFGVRASTDISACPRSARSAAAARVRRASRSPSPGALGRFGKRPELI